MKRSMLASPGYRDDAELVSHTADDNLVGYPFVVQSVPFVGYDIGPFVVTVPFVVVNLCSAKCSFCRLRHWCNL